MHFHIEETLLSANIITVLLTEISLITARQYQTHKLIAWAKYYWQQKTGTLNGKEYILD